MNPEQYNYENENADDYSQEAYYQDYLDEKQQGLYDGEYDEWYDENYGDDEDEDYIF